MTGECIPSPSILKATASGAIVTRTRTGEVSAFSYRYGYDRRVTEIASAGFTSREGGKFTRLTSGKLPTHSAIRGPNEEGSYCA